jgi:hypothetical protein
MALLKILPFVKASGTLLRAQQEFRYSFEHKHLHRIRVDISTNLFTDTNTDSSGDSESDSESDSDSDSDSKNEIILQPSSAAISPKIPRWRRVLTLKGRSFRVSST